MLLEMPMIFMYRLKVLIANNANIWAIVVCVLIGKVSTVIMAITMEKGVTEVLPG